MLSCSNGVSYWSAAKPLTGCRSRPEKNQCTLWLASTISKFWIMNKELPFTEKVRTMQMHNEKYGLQEGFRQFQFKPSKEWFHSWVEQSEVKSCKATCVYCCVSIIPHIPLRFRHPDYEPKGKLPIWNVFFEESCSISWWMRLKEQKTLMVGFLFLKIMPFFRFHKAKLHPDNLVKIINWVWMKTA